MRRRRFLTWTWMEFADQLAAVALRFFAWAMLVWSNLSLLRPVCNQTPFGISPSRLNNCKTKHNLSRFRQRNPELNPRLPAVAIVPIYRNSASSTDVASLANPGFTR